MKTSTNHLSFILRPSTVHVGGVGVFALHDIVKGTHMALFSDSFQEEIHTEEEIPEELQGYCLNREDGTLLCPKYFNRLDIGNYVNHSETPNMRYEEGKGYFALRDISASEEILAN